MTTIFSLLLSEKELPNCILDFGDGLMVSHSSQDTCCKAHIITRKALWVLVHKRGSLE